MDHRQMSTEDLEKFGFIRIEERKLKDDVRMLSPLSCGVGSLILPLDYRAPYIIDSGIRSFPGDLALGMIGRESSRSAS